MTNSSGTDKLFASKNMTNNLVAIANKLKMGNFKKKENNLIINPRLDNALLYEIFKLIDSLFCK